MDLDFMVLIFTRTYSLLTPLIPGIYISIWLCLRQIRGRGRIPRRQVVHQRQSDSSPTWKRSHQDQLGQCWRGMCNRVYWIFHYLGTVELPFFGFPLLWLTMRVIELRATWRLVRRGSSLLPLLRTSPCTSVVLTSTSTIRTRKSCVVCLFLVFFICWVYVDL